MGNSTRISTCSFSFLLLLLVLHVNAQRAKADSITDLLKKTKGDTNKVNLMWQLADVTGNYDPSKALVLSSQALYLSEQIKYVEGQSRSLGILANTFVNIGNYPRALEYYLEKLKLEEERDNPRNLASALMNIGVVYVYQEQYLKALEYYYKSDSVITRNQIQSLKYYSLQNLGDIYDRLSNTDSAYRYFNESLQVAGNLNDNNLLGAPMTGLGHTYLKTGNFLLSINYYRS